MQELHVFPEGGQCDWGPLAGIPLLVIMCQFRLKFVLGILVSLLMHSVGLILCRGAEGSVSSICWDWQ